MPPSQRKFPSIFSLSSRPKPGNYATLEDAEVVYPSWPPQNPRKILLHRAAYKTSIQSQKYRAPEGVFEDSPLFSLYRLYESFMADDAMQLRNEMELFWSEPRWKVRDIPDPGEENDPERYAVLACMPALLADAFNDRIAAGFSRGEPSGLWVVEPVVSTLDPRTAESLDRGWLPATATFEDMPEWTEKVKPLEKTLHIPHSQTHRGQLRGKEDDDASVVFLRKNILTIKLNIRFA